MPSAALPLLNVRFAPLKFAPVLLARVAVLTPAPTRFVVVRKACAWQGIVALAAFLLATFTAPAFAQITVGGSNPITITTSNDGVGVSASSTVTVPASTFSSGATVTSISVTFNGLNTSQLNAQAIALKAPDGTALDLVSGACNSNSATFELADTGASGSDNFHGMIPGIGFDTCPSALSGTYLPTDYYPGEDVFDNGGGGPASYLSGGIGASGTTTCNELISSGECGTYNFTSAFGLPTAATNLEGTWTLYIATQVSGYNPTGSLGSWSITFTTEAASATTTSLSASPNGSASLVFTSSDVNGDATPPTSVTLTATVTTAGLPVTAGTVTFYDSTGTSAGMGMVLASGVAVNGSGQAQAIVTFPGTEEGPRAISAVYSGVSGAYAASTSGPATVLTTNHPYNPSSGSTFCNGPITVNESGAGTPYPSLLALGNSFSQLQGTIESVTVTLNNISLQNEAELANLGFLLQAPGTNTSGTASSGNAFQFLSWAGNPFTGPGPLTMSDMGTSQIPYNMAPSCTTCLPTDNWIDIGSDNPDTFPSPAPSTIGTAAPTGSATFTTEFGGQGANNTWSLYLDTRLVEPGPAGTIGSWCLNFTMQANAHPTATTVSGSPNPASFTPPATTGSVTLTAKVSVTDSSGLSVDAGTVTFVDGTTSLGSSAVSNGQATLSTTLAEGTHEIVATYSGTNTGTEFGISTGKYDQRVDTTTAIPTTGSGAGPYTYCNKGAITTPGLGADAGAASPYPSNIFVTNLPGTVNAVTVTLNNFSTKDQGDLLSLLVGPGGNNLDFFSLTGSNVSTAPTINLTFSDTASTLIPSGSSGNLSSSGTFKPTSYNTSITYPQCPPNAPNCASPPVGPPLPSNPFTPTNKAATAGTAILGNANEAGVFGGTSSSTYNGNGTWSLYMNDGGPTGGGEVTNLTGGWCVNLTENLPSVSVDKSHTATFTQGQQAVPFTIDIKNNGPGPTGDPTQGNNPLTVTDTLNSAFSYASSSGTGWNCSATGQTVNCTNDSSVAQGDTYAPLTINVNVSPTASTTTSTPNQVQVSGGGVTNATSNTDSVTILPAAVLAVQKSHTGTFTQGQTAQWNITVSNTASSGMTYGTITVSDTLPAGYTLNSSSSTGSVVWSCTGTGTINCTTSGGIAGGTDSVINLTVNVPVNSPISVSNVASAFGGGDLTHSSLATAAVSNTDTVSVTQVPATVSITSGNMQSALINTAFVSPLTVTVTDAGGVVIPSQSVTFTAPATGPSGTFSNSGTTITSSTNSSGQASESFTANGMAGGPYSVTVSAGTASGVFSLTNTAPVVVPTEIVVSGYPSPVYVGVAHTGNVTVEDSGGNPVTTYSGTATITTSDSGATVTTPVTVTNGVGTFTATFEMTGTQSITAAIAGLTSVSQTGIVVNPFARSVTTIASLTTTAATIDVFGLGFTAPSGQLSFTDVTTSSPVTAPVTLNTATAAPSLLPEVTTSTGASSHPDWTELADVNGDGILDLITSIYGTDSVSVQLGNGDGTFGTAASILIATGFGPAEVHAVSLRGNGTLDLIVGSANLNQIAVLLGNGGGTFGSPTFYTAGSSGNTAPSLTTGDFNDDGNLDVAVASAGGNTVSVFLGNGSGGLTASGPAIIVGNDPVAIRAGDFNGDGYSDLAVANFSDGTVSILLNNQNGTFTSTAVGVGSGPSSGPQALAINGTGSALLLAVANFNDDTISEFTSKGDGTLGTQTIAHVGNGPDAVNFADFNNDGIEDLVAANSTDGTLSLVIGGGTLTVLGPFNAGNTPESAAVGDLDKDGTPDIVVANKLSDNTGVFLSGTQISVPYSGLTLTDANTYSATYTPDAASKYGPSTSQTVNPGPPTLTSIAITPATATVAAGQTQAYVATGTFSNNSTQNISSSVTWSSSNPADATIAATGIATGVAPGSVTITAKSGSVTSNSATLTVTAPTLTSIAITPATATVAVGQTQAYVATGTYSNNTTANITSTVNWSSSNTADATIAATGIATGVAPGSAMITASLSGVTSNSATLTVTAPTLTSIAITPATASVAVGQTQAYVATGTFSNNTTQNITSTVTWSSSNTADATIAATGIATGVAPGSATITASLSGVTSNSAKLTVTGPIATISPTSIDFGTLYLGSVVTRTVTITNTGNAAMTIGNPRVAIVQGGNSDEFVTVNLCAKSLPAGKSCTMTVTFIAGPFYTTQTATLMITDNAAGSPQSVTLTATVIDPVALFSAGSLSFGTVKAQSGSVSKSIIVTSAGGTALSIGKVSISGANAGDYSEIDSCSSTTLSPKAICSITVTFKPTAKGSRSATLQVPDNARNSPQAIPLFGTGN
jgi:uncharacterized protein YjdB